MFARLMTGPFLMVRNIGGRADFGIKIITFSFEKLFENTDVETCRRKWISANVSQGTCVDGACRVVSHVDADWSLGDGDT